MIDKEQLQMKLRLQKARNLISKIEGIEVLDCKEQNIFDEKFLREIGFYSDTKVPDSMIPEYTNDSEIVEWISNLIDFSIERIWYIWVDGFLVKIQILNIRTAILSLWNNIDPVSKGFILITESIDKMYEIASDSRDENNILFDVYTLS